MKKVILDTNFLMIPYQFKVDIFEEIRCIVEEEYELITISGVVKELEKIKKSKGRSAVAAKIGLELIKAKNVKVINSDSEEVDNKIIELSDENTIVATNDIKLKNKLKNKNIKIIYLRSKKYLKME
jgi:hypothetical protein